MKLFENAKVKTKIIDINNEVQVVEAEVVNIIGGELYKLMTVHGDVVYRKKDEIYPVVLEEKSIKKTYTAEQVLDIVRQAFEGQEEQNDER